MSEQGPSNYHHFRPTKWYDSRMTKLGCDFCVRYVQYNQWNILNYWLKDYDYRTRDPIKRRALFEYWLFNFENAGILNIRIGMFELNVWMLEVWMLIVWEVVKVFVRDWMTFKGEYLSMWVWRLVRLILRSTHCSISKRRLLNMSQLWTSHPGFNKVGK